MSALKALRVGIPIFLIAINMRAGLILLGPLLPIIQAEYGIGVLLESILGAAPLICFSLSALFMPALIKRADTKRIITWAITLVTASLFLRTLFNVPSLLIFSISLGIAVAILNYMLPVWVRENNKGSAGLITGTYAAIMGIFSAVALAITVPLAMLTDLSWRFAMLPWFLIGLVTSILWWSKYRGARLPPSDTRHSQFWRSSVLRNRKAWALTLFFGMLNMVHYASAIWMPTILVSKGMPLVETGFVVAVATLLGSLLSLPVPQLASRGRGFRLPLIVFSALLAASFLAVALSTGPILWLWVILCNIGVYVTFSLALYLVVFMAKDDQTTKDLSIMMQSIGYLLATTAPILLGAVFLASGNWGTSLLLLVALAVVQIGLSFTAGNRQKI